MPRQCEPCRYHTADDSVTACANCGGPVKFTLLPPLNFDPEPMACLPSTTKVERYPSPLGFRQLPIGKLEVFTALVVAGLVALAFGLLSVTPDAFVDRTARVTPGMSLAAAMEVMGGPRNPTRRFTFSSGDTAMEFFQEIERPFDDAGVGTLTYQSRSDALVIHFKDGVVTGVESKTVEGGIGRSVTVIHQPD